MAKLKHFRVTLEADGRPLYVGLLAANAEEAERLALESQDVRQSRFPLTFDRLDASLETGEMHPMLAVDPKKGGAALSEAIVKAEIEKRKRDQARYDDDKFKVTAVEEMP